MAKQKTLRFFATEQEALGYLTSELVSTLNDDLTEMAQNGEPAAERRDMRNRIHDIELITPRLIFQDTHLALIKKLTLVIEDFMPNIGKCVLQDYQRLNEALCESKAVLADRRTT